MRGRLALCCVCLVLSACGGPKPESSVGDIANQAESLQRAADATTDQLIEQIEADAAEEQATNQPGNAAR